MQTRFAQAMQIYCRLKTKKDGDRFLYPLNLKDVGITPHIKF